MPTSLLSLADVDGEGSLARAFGRQAPLEIEIGSGKGRFLMSSAERMPDTDFLGIERALRFCRLAAERAERRSIPNLRFIRAEASWLLSHAVPDAAVRALHVLFPDPWPKKRHHKRRLFDEGFVDEVERVLVDGGALNVATDHAEYFAAIETILGGRARLASSPLFLLTDRRSEGETGLTHYEVKYQAGGRAINRASWTRRPRAVI
jgi:tRNA (guanine-N7-)-methyltransferase